MSRVTLSMIAAMSEADQKKVTEADFQEALNAYARSRGWLVLHLRQSAFAGKSGRMIAVGDDGFPDTVLARDGHVYFWELKKEGKWLTEKQDQWMKATDGDVFWPSDAKYMMETLE